MERKKQADTIVKLLKREYPDAVCSLDARKPHELLIAARLAAQCTDERVNKVCIPLFKKYPDIDSFADADVGDVEDIVRPCGLYKTKAKSIVEMSKMLRDRFNYTVPDNMDDLLALPGVGRKIANLIISDVYGKPAIVADTHCIRITNLLGLCDSNDPHKVEKQLVALIDPPEQSGFCHRLVFHGRAVCVARRPDCENCVLSGYCDYYANRTAVIGDE